MKPPAPTMQIYSACGAITAPQKHKVTLQPAERECIPTPVPERKPKCLHGTA